jgi:ABC-type glucose/galactose transport system permease subunit
MFSKSYREESTLGQVTPFLSTFGQEILVPGCFQYRSLSANVSWFRPHYAVFSGHFILLVLKTAKALLHLDSQVAITLTPLLTNCSDFVHTMLE